VEPNGATPLEPPAHLSVKHTMGLQALASQPLIPNPLFSRQWNLRMIEAANAWAIITGNTNIVVAIIDTGVDYTHPDLAANMWRNPGETGVDDTGRDKATNGVDDDTNGFVDDVHGVDVWNMTGDPMDRGFTSCCWRSIQT
jgi:subtilisin family serine protease